jgi:hypothetical protein
MLPDTSDGLAAVLLLLLLAPAPLLLLPQWTVEAACCAVEHSTAAHVILMTLTISLSRRLYALKWSLKNNVSSGPNSVSRKTCPGGLAGCPGCCV